MLYRNMCEKSGMTTRDQSFLLLLTKKQPIHIQPDLIVLCFSNFDHQFTINKTVSFSKLGCLLIYFWAIIYLQADIAVLQIDFSTPETEDILFRGTNLEIFGPRPSRMQERRWVLTES